jgi:hypothetical protein
MSWGPNTVVVPVKNVVVVKLLKFTFAILMVNAGTASPATLQTLNESATICPGGIPAAVNSDAGITY